MKVLSSYSLLKRSLLVFLCFTSLAFWLSMGGCAKRPSSDNQTQRHQAVKHIDEHSNDEGGLKSTFAVEAKPLICSSLHGLASKLYSKAVRSDPLIGGATPTSLCVSPDGTVIALGTAAGWVEFVDSRSGCPLRILPAHEDEITGLKFISSQRVLVTASSDGAIRYWDLSTLSIAASIEDYPDRSKDYSLPPADRKRPGYCSMGIDRDAEILVYTSTDGFIRVRGLETRDLRKQIFQGYFTPARLALNSSGRLLAIPAVGFGASGVLLWDVTSGTLVLYIHGAPGETFRYDSKGNPVPIIRASKILLGNNWYSVNEIVLPNHISTNPRGYWFDFSPDGEWLALGCIDGTVWLVNTQDLRTRWAQVGGLPGDQLGISAVKLSKEHLAAATEGGVIFVWDLASGEISGRFSLQGSVTALTFLGENSLVAVWDNTKVSRLELSRGLAWTYKSAISIDHWVLSPKGTYIAIIGDGSLSLWDTDTKRMLWSINDNHRKHVQIAAYTPKPAFTPDEKTLVVFNGGYYETEGILLLSAKSGRLESIISLKPITEAYPSCFAISPNGSLLGIGISNMIVVYNLSTGKYESFNLPASVPSSEITFMFFDREDKDVLWIGDRKGGVYKFDFRAKKWIWIVASPEGKGAIVRIDPYEDKVLVVWQRGGFDRFATLYDRANGEKIRDFDLEPRWKGKHLADVGRLRDAAFINPSEVAIATYGGFMIVDAAKGEILDIQPVPVPVMAGEKIIAYTMETSHSLFCSVESMEISEKRDLIGYSTLCDVTFSLVHLHPGD